LAPRAERLTGRKLAASRAAAHAEVMPFPVLATASGLKKTDAYVARTPERRERLSSDEPESPAIEAADRELGVLAEISGRKRARLVEKASHAPELVVIQP